MDNKYLKDNLIARWLDNRLSNEEKESLESSDGLDDLKIVIDEIDTWKVKKFDTEAGLEDLKKRRKQVEAPTLSQHTKTQKRNWFQIAASIIILIAAGCFTWIYFSNTTTTISTKIAENKTIKLPDGSVVKLDVVSSINYKEKDWQNNRIINLKGQAFFDIAKGSTLKVISDKGSVEVLGTQFNVITNDDTFEVKCYEGKVAVNYNTSKEILTKGLLATVKNNRLYTSTYSTNTPSWINGYSTYTKIDLLTVTKDLEKYYKTKINLPKRYQNLQFTGTLTHSDLKTALRTLFTTMEIKYNLDENNSVNFK